jgi:phospholipid-binding lipoprotein MlaA
VVAIVAVKCDNLLQGWWKLFRPSIAAWSKHLGIILLVAAGQLINPGMTVPPQQLATPALASGAKAAEAGLVETSALTAGEATARPPAGVSPEAGNTPTEETNITVAARRHHAPGDPAQAINMESYALTQSVDKAIVGPIAIGYRHVVPSPIRSGLHNAIFNLREPTIFLNYILQIKPGKAAETLGRFVINSTVGVAGLIDVAKRHPFNLPHRPNGFADSFGFYGIKPGPYMFLPLVGPTTLRDLIGGGLDRLVLPVAVGHPFNQLAYSIPTGVISALDHRVRIDEQLQETRSATNPYAAMRAAYLASRQAEIDGLKGKAPGIDATPPDR